MTLSSSKLFTSTDGLIIHGGAALKRQAFKAISFLLRIGALYFSNVVFQSSREEIKMNTMGKYFVLWEGILIS